MFYLADEGDREACTFISHKILISDEHDQECSGNLMFLKGVQVLSRENYIELK